MSKYLIFKGVRVHVYPYRFSDGYVGWKGIKTPHDLIYTEKERIESAFGSRYFTFTMPENEKGYTKIAAFKHDVFEDS